MFRKIVMIVGVIKRRLRMKLDKLGVFLVGLNAGLATQMIVPMLGDALGLVSAIVAVGMVIAMLIMGPEG